MKKQPNNFEDKRAKRTMEIEVDNGDEEVLVTVEVVCNRLENDAGECGQLMFVTKEVANRLQAAGKVKIITKEV